MKKRWRARARALDFTRCCCIFGCCWRRCSIFRLFWISAWLSAQSPPGTRQMTVSAESMWRCCSNWQRRASWSRHAPANRSWKSCRRRTAIFRVFQGFFVHFWLNDAKMENVSLLFFFLDDFEFYQFFELKPLRSLGLGTFQLLVLSDFLWRRNGSDCGRFPTRRRVREFVDVPDVGRANQHGRIPTGRDFWNRAKFSRIWRFYSRIRLFFKLWKVLLEQVRLL